MSTMWEDEENNQTKPRKARLVAPISRFLSNLYLPESLFKGCAVLQSAINENTRSLNIVFAEFFPANYPVYLSTDYKHIHHIES